MVARGDVHGDIQVPQYSSSKFLHLRSVAWILEVAGHDDQVGSEQVDHVHRVHDAAQTVRLGAVDMNVGNVDKSEQIVVTADRHGVPLPIHNGALSDGQVVQPGSRIRCDRSS